MRLTKKIDENIYNLNNNVVIANVRTKLGKLEDLFDGYGIETLEDLNVILAEYFCEIKDHTFKTTK